MDGDGRLRVTLLGAFRVSRGSADLLVSGTRSRALIARLALAGGRAVEPDVLADAIWADDPPTDPAHALQALVSRLRRALGSAGSVPQAVGGYRLDVRPDEVDALRFEQLAAAGRGRLLAGDPAAAADALGGAAGLWADRPGVEPAAVGAGSTAAATRLAHLSVETVADLADAELRLGRTEAAAARLTALLADHPVHERAAALLLDALAGQGRQADALARYARIRESLAETLGIEPGSALQERHLRLLRSEPATREGSSAAGRAAPAPADGVEPAGGERAGASNLPAPLTGFVGRDDDLARIAALLGTGRLVTVIGPGGAGKTRLAVEAARRHRAEHPDGTWLVDLAPVTEPAKLGAAVLAGIGLRGDTMFEARTRAGDDELAVLTDQFAGRPGLLLMDNCEHLVEAVAHLVAALLPRCSGLRVLATSREALAVDGEALVPLGPLALPEPDVDVDRARTAASVRLFVERAAAVRPGFDVTEANVADVARVVHSLDGLPLALELAAARLRTLALPDLAAGLSDRFRLLTTGNRTAVPRHRTLRAVIAWSWEPLAADARTVAERISILPGGVTPESATAVCAGSGVPARDVPELLAGLVDRSLLQLVPDTGRYRMLETIRAYGRESLAAHGDPTGVRDLAAGHFAGLVARQDPRLRGPDQLAALRVLRAEYDNVLAALRHRCGTGDAAGAIALAVDLTWYWQLLGEHADAVYWLRRALSTPTSRAAAAGFAGAPAADAPAADAPAADAPAADAPAGVAGRSDPAPTGGRGDRTPAARRAREAPDAAAGVPAEEAREVAEEVLLLNQLAVQDPPPPDWRDRLRELTGRLSERPEPPAFGAVLVALRLATVPEAGASGQIVQRLVDGPDRWLAALAHLFRAQFAENAGDLVRVRSDIAVALELFARAGDRWGLATALPLRALLRRYDGDLPGALADLAEARVLAREFGSLRRSDETFLDLRVVDLHIRLGDPERAAELLDAARWRAARPASAETTMDALTAGLWLRLGEPDRARELVDSAERGLSARPPFDAVREQALVALVRGALRLDAGDGPGADAALRRAYAAAVRSTDMPILADVAVTVAGLAAHRGHHRQAAVLLGLAARLRGAHDRTDLQVRAWSRRCRAELGGAGFARAYDEGWQRSVSAALAAADPARLPGAPPAGTPTPGTRGGQPGDDPDRRAAGRPTVSGGDGR